MTNTIEEYLNKFNIKNEKRALGKGFAYKLMCDNGDSYTIKYYDENTVTLEINCNNVTFCINGCEIIMNSHMPLKGESYINIIIYHGINQFHRIESSEICVKNFIYNN